MPKIEWEWKVNITHILTALTVFATIIGWSVKVEARDYEQDYRLQSLEATTRKLAENDVLLTANQAAVIATQRTQEAILEILKAKVLR